MQSALKIIRAAAQRPRPETIGPSDNLELDLGLDSMQRVELLMALEEKLGGDVEESRLAEVYAHACHDTMRAFSDGGQVQTTRPPAFQRQALLAEHTFRLVGQLRDTAHRFVNTVHCEPVVRDR